MSSSPSIEVKGDRRDPAAVSLAHPLLQLNNVEVIYEDVILVLRGLSMIVNEGQIVALLGSNGAGKTTTLKSIMGLLESEHGEVTDGEILYRGQRLNELDPATVVRSGISLVMEGRRVFENLSVRENLIAGAYAKGGANANDEIDRVFGYFPRLKDRTNQNAGYLSGGEQQMLAIGRALMAHPKLLMLDEPSLGLAPMLVAEIFAMLRKLNEESGTTILLVEQNARRALEVAHHGYLMENGRIVLDGPASELAENPDVKEFYLGLSEGGHRKSYRDVKHYKRRKRWL